jgi:hypothetical protein
VATATAGAATASGDAPSVRQHIRVILDKFFMFKLVEAPAILTWVFSDPRQLQRCAARARRTRSRLPTAAASPFVWEVLRSTINKTLR